MSWFQKNGAILTSNFRSKTLQGMKQRWWTRRSWWRTASASRTASFVGTGSRPRPRGCCQEGSSGWPSSGTKAPFSGTFFQKSTRKRFFHRKVFEQLHFCSVFIFFGNFFSWQRFKFQTEKRKILEVSSALVLLRSFHPTNSLHFLHLCLSNRKCVRTKIHFNWQKLKLNRTIPVK